MAQCTITCGIAGAWLGYGNQKGYSTYSSIGNRPTSGSKVKITNLQLKIPTATINSGISGIYLHFNINNTYSAYVTNVPKQSAGEYSTNLIIRDDHRVALGDFLSNFTENKSIAIEVNSGTISQALLPGEYKFQLIFDYEYVVAAPVLNELNPANALAGSEVTLSWTDVGNNNVALAQYKIYNWGSEMASISSSNKTYTFTIPSDLANQSLYSFTVAAVDTNGNISLKSNEVLLRVYQKIGFTYFNIYKDDKIIEPYIGSNLEGNSTKSSYQFKWDYNSFNDGRTIKKVEFADDGTSTPLTNTVLNHSSILQLDHSYYIQITDSLGFESTSEKITISEYIPPKYTLTLPQSGRLESRKMEIAIKIPSGESINDISIRINGKKEITTGITTEDTDTDNTYSFTINNTQVPTRTNFYLGVEYSQNAPIEGTSSQIVDVDTTTFFFQTAPAAPVISDSEQNATDIKYLSPYVYETVKIELSSLASATSDSGDKFEYFIKYNDILISATVSEDKKSITAPIAQLPIDKLKADGINVQVVAVDNYGESVISTTSSSTFYKLILPTIEIINIACEKHEIEIETETNTILGNTLTITYKINGSNITGATATDTDSVISFHSTLLEQVIATQAINYSNIEKNGGSYILEVNFENEEWGENLQNKIITGQEPTIQDSLFASFYFNSFEEYTSNSSNKTFNYDFITYPAGSIAAITEIIPYGKYEIDLSKLNWKDAIGGLSGVKQINLILTPNNTNYDIIRIPWTTVTDTTTTLKSSYEYTYQRYFLQATEIIYTISFELVYKSIIIPYTLPNTTANFTIAKWTPENAVITKADETGIVFKFPDNTPCGDENSFSKVDLTIGESAATDTTTVNLTITNDSSTYTWPTAPTTDTSYDITLTYYNKKENTIVQTFKNYIVHISGATVAIRKQFLGINVTEDYGTDNSTNYPIVAIKSLKVLGKDTPILKISTSGNEEDGAHLLYFNNGKDDDVIGGFLKHSRDENTVGFIAENLLSVNNGAIITEFSDFGNDSSSETKLLYFNSRTTSGDITSIGGFLKPVDDNGFIAENLLGIKNGDTITKFSDFLTNTSAQNIYLTKTDAIDATTLQGKTVDDDQSANASYLWTSNKINSYITNKINSIPQVTRSTFNLDVLKEGEEGEEATEWAHDNIYDDYYKNFEHQLITSTDQEISISCIPCTKFPITAAKLITSDGKYYLQIRMASPPESSQEITVSVITIPE